MGVPESPDLANLYGWYFENKANILADPLIGFYGRYIDDCFGIVAAPSGDAARQYMSQKVIFDGCQITWEVGSLRCNFLDATFYFDTMANLQWKPYRKPNNHMERIPWISGHPYDVKRGTFIGEMSRLATLSSQFTSYLDSIRDLVGLYVRRGYPHSDVKKWTKRYLMERWEKRLSESTGDATSSDVLVLKSTYNTAWNYFSAKELGDEILGYWRSWCRTRLLTNSSVEQIYKSLLTLNHYVCLYPELYRSAPGKAAIYERPAYLDVALGGLDIAALNSQINNMSNSLTTLVPVLDGSNWREWSSRMKAYLMSQGQWYVIESTLPAEGAANRETWVGDNHRAMGNISLRVNASILERLAAKTTAGEMWNDLESRYSQQGVAAVFAEFKAAMNVVIPINSHPGPAMEEMFARFERLSTLDLQLPGAYDMVVQLTSQNTDVKKVDPASIRQAVIRVWEQKSSGRSQQRSQGSGGEAKKLSAIKRKGKSKTNHNEPLIWMLDSGASSHFTFDLDDFVEYEPLQKEMLVGTANGVAVAKGSGTVMLNCPLNPGEHTTVRIAWADAPVHVDILGGYLRWAEQTPETMIINCAAYTYV
ncbi:hypothetical protein NUW54_g10588 [Trametes sanguinea]|uniref:Uncharacterized protein n=1 Tax=Trametes sanguinea TaxID=158606 RepID=A0ACC1NX10_9APHY|nr:hypothetical protein NUW54_g10588 [Trametes sanguinea]